MKRLILALLVWVLGVTFAHTQTALAVRPYSVHGANSSSTISTTNVFQSLFAASTGQTGRTDCLIQNNGAASMWLFFGPIASALTTNSLTLTSGSSYRCNNGVVVQIDAISITGTISQNFLAIQY